MHSRYTQYYLNQSGGGLSDIGSTYKTQQFYQVGRNRNQTGGAGVGSFFSGLFRYLKPLVTSGFSAVKNQSIKTGADILSEIGQKPFKQILKEQGGVAATALTQRAAAKLRKMQKGSGKRKKKKTRSNIKRPAKGKREHLRSKHRKGKKRAQKKQTGNGKKRRKKANTNLPAKKTRFIDIFDNNG